MEASGCTTEPKDLLARLAAPATSSLPSLRLLVILAHPDDEVVALGGRLERLQHGRFLTVTDGVPRDGKDATAHGFATLRAYGEARRQELLEAFRHAGLTDEVCPRFAGCVSDQTASLHLEELARALAVEIEAFQPEALLTHAYEGGHPDHDACSFAVHAAVRLAQVAAQTPGRENGSVTAAPLPVFEAPFYRMGEAGRMLTGSFLAAEGADAVSVELSSSEQANKRARLACFRSQAQTLAQFGVEREAFRKAPAYDFTQPPHAGPLFYEQFPWGMTGERFRERARTAQVALFGERP